jgi:hypothetical protein
MAYTTINKPSEYFNTVTYSGNGSTQSITGVGFQPDWVWIKKRNDTAFHQLFDVVRGATKGIFSNSTNAEAVDAGNLQSFDSDGFTSGSFNGTNGSGGTYVAWNWLAGGTGVSNTDGSITSTVSASTTSGFSIVTYTGNGTGGATIGHGLSSAPAWVIIKNRTSGTFDWLVYHKALGATKYMALNQTDASTTSAIGWNNTEPSSSVVTLGTANAVNTNLSNYVAYCFAEKKGFSKFGSYTGNGSTDGTFVYTGFKPAFVIIKNTSIIASWTILDNKRSPFNSADDVLRPNSNSAEAVDTTYADTDFLSNGFKLRTDDAWFNTNGETFIYMAFAEEPLVGTNNIPATAR